MVQSIESNIRAIIAAKGLVQRHVAEQSGIDQKAFSNMLHGRGTLKAIYIPSIAKALGVTPNVLFGVEDRRESA